MVTQTEIDASGDLAIRVLAMPADTNPRGDVFGGWIVSQMDLAGLSLAGKLSESNVVTVTIDGLTFLQPVDVGDFVCCRVKLEKIGRTSMKIRVTVFAVPYDGVEGDRKKVVEGMFTYVAVDRHGKPHPVKRG